MARKTVSYLALMMLCFNCFGQRIFNQKNTKGEWQYIYPFKDKSYVLAIRHNLDTTGNPASDDNAFIYFGKKNINSEEIFWKEHVFIRIIRDNVRYEDYNSDGIKDLALFTNTGGRGSNEYYNLYLVNPKKHTLNKVIGFDKITNPTFNDEHRVILGYGYAGANYYSIYRLDKNNKVFQVGESFEDIENLNLNQKISEILRKYKR